MSLTVTATAAGSGGTAVGIDLTVKVITGQAASPIGTAATSTSASPPELAITPADTGSWVYGSVINAGAGTAYTAATGTTFSQNTPNTSNGSAYGTFRSTSTTTASTPVTLGASAPNTGSGNFVMAMQEIVKGTGLAEDASSPAVASTLAASTITTASFTPPAGSLLVAIVASDASFNGTDSMTMSVSDSSGLTWTKRAAGTPTVGSATYQVTSIWTAPVPAGGNTSAGGLSMGSVAMAGAGAGGNATAAGGLSMATAAMAGSGAQAFASAGGLSLAPMAMSGSGSVPLPVASTGGLTMAGMAMAAAGGVPVTASGGLSLAAISMAGAGLEPVASSGSLSLAAVAMAGAAAVPAPPFPQSPLDLRCELDLAGTWTDVSSYVYQRSGDTPPVNLARGRADESSQANPGAGTWEWNNRDGRFSPKNPLSPYYGQLGRNTPVRWSVPARSSYLRLEADDADRAYVNDDSNIDITGSIEIRVALRLSDWQGGALAHKWDGGACWNWLLLGDGTLMFGWYDGSADHSVTSTAPLPFTGGDQALRVTMSAATGTVTFYTGSAIGGSWTQLGSAASGTSGSSTSIATSSGSALTVGYSFDLAPGQICGRVYELQLWNGISGSGGTLAADGIFSAQTAGATSWTDAQGNAWQLAGGAEISDRDYRWHGQMSAQPPKWDVTGRDMAVAAQAGGPLRLISQGQAPLTSPMKRALLSQSGDLAVVALWPCEDGQGAAAIGSATGGPLMGVSGGTGDGSATTTGPAFAADSSFLAAAPLPTLNGSSWYGQVPSYGGSTTAVTRFLAKIGSTLPTSAENHQALVRVALTGAAAWIDMYVFYTGDIGFTCYDSSGTVLYTSGGGYDWPGSTAGLWWSIEALPVSGGTQYSLVGLAPGASTGNALTSTTISGTPGAVTGVWVNPGGWATDTVVGEISVQSAWESLFDLYQPLNAWTGETAAARVARLAGENGWASRVIGPPAASALMGAQAIDTLGNLLQACEDADRGQILEPRQALAVAYRTLGSMCGQAVALPLDYAASEPGGVDGGGGDSGLDPTYDDQLSRNDWTLTRTAGQEQGATYQYQLDDGSAMSISQPPVGVGDYADTLSVNVLADSQLPNLAGWMVHVGTVDEARWPAIPLNLARPETAALYQSALDADIGDYLQITDAPDLVVVDPVRQLAFQVTEALGGFHYAMTFNAVPESPYETGIYDDPVYGRADTDGSSLASAATYPQSTLSVATTGPSGILWTAAAADFPFDIGVSGMRLTVTDIAGASSPQTFYVTPAVNGVEKDLAEGADVRLWFPPIYALQ